MSLEIQGMQPSIISHKTKFTCGEMEMRKIIEVRKANLSITSMIWITKQAVVSDGFLYNPKALIMIWLN